MSAPKQPAPDAAPEGVRSFVSRSCIGVTCHMCGKAPAVMKVGEEIAHDDPEPMRHNATAYLCAGCEDIVLHGAWNRRATPARDREVEALRSAIHALAAAAFLVEGTDEYRVPVHALDSVVFANRDLRTPASEGGETV